MLSEYQITLRNKTRKKDKPYAIPKRSKKLKAEFKTYIPAMKKFLEDNLYCAIKMDGCTIRSTCVHHTEGRAGAKLHDQAGWLPSCSNCNLSVETHDAEAREKGFKKSKFLITHVEHDPELNVTLINQETIII